MDCRIGVLAAVLICACLRGGADTTATTLTQAPAASTSTTTHTTVTSTSTMPSAPATLDTSTTASTTSTTLNSLIETFTDVGGSVCMEDGRPFIRMYSKTTCHNCEWSKHIFDDVAIEYAEKGLVTAHRWVFDDGDDALTETREDDIPDLEYDVFYAEEGNPTWNVPYFNFGCRFTRVGNGYQVRDDPGKEEAEYRAVIEQILSEVDNI